MDVVDQPVNISVGELFEDCRYEPMICTSVSAEDDDLFGISLIDGHGPVACSLKHCGPEPLTVIQAVWIKQNFAEYLAARTSLQEIADIIPRS
ncbi:MAG: hypothetical protein DLM58_00555 [Pseudonocardiales bacterium]|nr:MAG: hypothetical protein DLM58_00555 [Pseudonocardiales bacterium]